MMYSKNLFEMLSSMTENKRSTKSKSHFSQKKLLMQQMGNLDQIAPNLCKFKSHDPLYKNLSNVKFESKKLNCPFCLEACKQIEDVIVRIERKNCKRR